MLRDGRRKADQVAHALMTEIVDGSAPVGSLLPKEAELADRFGVTRGVIREAIKLLEVHRLVHPIKRRGTEVLDPLSSISADVLRAMLTPGGNQIDPGTFSDLLEIRTLLDIEMTSACAARRTEEDLAAIKFAVQRLRDALSEGARVYSNRMNDVAVAIARGTHNRLYEMLVHWNQMVHRDLEDIFINSRPASEPHTQGVELLYQLIEQQDVDGVRAIVTAYHQWATPRLKAAAALASGASLEELGVVE